jgi:hypothetical protein
MFEVLGFCILPKGMFVDGSWCCGLCVCVRVCVCVWKGAFPAWSATATTIHHAS